MKHRPLLSVALAAVIVLLAFYKTMGGIDGIRSKPGESLIVAIIAAFSMVWVFWFRYRKLEQESPYVAVPDPAPGAPADARLTGVQFVLVASRSKMLAVLAGSALGAAVISLVMWAQPGVCRAIGLASFAPFYALSLATFAGGMIRPERLEIAPWGLKHITFWRTRQWPWEEVRDVTVIKTLRGAWTSGIAFNRHASGASQAGPTRPMFRAVWPIPTEEVAKLINDARSRWSPAGASGLAPARKRLTDYITLALTWGAFAILIVLMMLRPCGP